MGCMVETVVQAIYRSKQYFDDFTNHQVSMVSAEKINELASFGKLLDAALRKVRVIIMKLGLFIFIYSYYSVLYRLLPN